MTHTEAANLILRAIDWASIGAYRPEPFPALLAAVATVMDAARADALEALREMVYETTHLSVMDPTGAHDCTISGDTLAKARRALAQSHREIKP